MRAAVAALAEVVGLAADQRAPAPMRPSAGAARAATANPRNASVVSGGVLALFLLLLHVVGDVLELHRDAGESTAEART